MKILATALLAFGIGTIASAHDLRLPFSPENEATIDFGKTVKVGSAETYTVGGIANFEKVASRLKEKGLEPRAVKFLGKKYAMVAITFMHWKNVVGCGCPKEFMDLSISYELTPDADGTRRVTPDILYASHPLRVHSLLNKFGTQASLAHFNRTERGGREWVDIYEQDGTLIYSLKLPKNLSPADSDVDFVTVNSQGSVNEKRMQIPPKTYFVYSENSRKYVSWKGSLFFRRPYKFPAPSPLSEVIHEIGFTPSHWEKYESHPDFGVWAWLPYK